MTTSERAFATFLLMSLLLIACKPSAPAPGNSACISLNNQPISVEIVSTQAAMARGLMGRTALPEGTGMLFIHPTPQRLSYWMKDTLIPLDIGFFTEDGTLQEIYPLYPRNLSPVSSHRTDLRFALEVPQGWFKAHNIRPGVKLNEATLRLINP